jgi:hypothetical protein
MATETAEGIAISAKAESVDADIQQVASQLASKHGASPFPAAGAPLPKRGRGRPRKDGQPVHTGLARTIPAQGPGSLAADPGLADPQPAQVVDPELVRKGTIALLKTLDQMIVRRVFKGAVTLGADEALAREFASEASLKVDNADMIANMAGEVCQKYNLASQYAPEFFLCLGLGTWGFQVRNVFGKLDDLAKIKKETERKDK